MMDASPHILGETEIDLPKIIFGLIFFIIWVLSAFVSWLTKRQQEAKRKAAEARDRLLAQGPVVRERARQQTPRIAEGLAQRFPEVRLPPAPIPQQQKRRPVQPAAPKPVRRAPKPPQRRAAPVLPPMPLQNLASTAQPYVNVTQPIPRRQAPTLGAAAVRQWLTPATLRHQFILTEILQPPLALRPGPHDRA